MKLETKTTDWIDRMETNLKKKWTSNESLLFYIDNLRKSNEMYAKDTEELFCELEDLLEEE